MRTRAASTPPRNSPKRVGRVEGRERIGRREDERRAPRDGLPSCGQLERARGIPYHLEPVEAVLPNHMLFFSYRPLQIHPFAAARDHPDAASASLHQLAVSQAGGRPNRQGRHVLVGDVEGDLGIIEHRFGRQAKPAEVGEVALGELRRGGPERHGLEVAGQPLRLGVGLAAADTDQKQASEPSGAAAVLQDRVSSESMAPSTIRTSRRERAITR